jgi:WD40 repeat protein
MYALAWDPSGAVLVSGGDGVLRWWDMQRGKCVQMRRAHQGTVQSLKVSPDGAELASCGDDGAIRTSKPPRPAQVGIRLLRRLPL